MTLPTIREMLADPRDYREGVFIDTASGVKRLAETVDKWQVKDFAATDNLWRTAAGLPIDPKRPAYLRSLQERPRGHSKSSDTALMVCWTLAAAPSRRSGVLAAVDKDQAKLLRNAIASIVSCNDWLRKVLDVRADAVVNKRTGSTATVLSSDVSSSWGLLLDFIVIDEWTHLPDDGLFVSLYSTAAKKANCTFSLVGNSGVVGSWQEPIYKRIQKDPEFYFSSLPGCVASWISKRQLKSQLALLPQPISDRYWHNRWVHSEGSAISGELIERALTLKGPMRGGEETKKHHTTVLGFDCGTRRDRSAVVVLSVRHGSDQVRVAWLKSWKAPRGGEVNFADVEAEIIRCHREYGLTGGAWFDPSASAVYIMQRVRRRCGLRTTPVPFTPMNLASMAKATIGSFELGQVAMYPHDEFERDLRSLQVAENSAGYRLVAPSDSSGHRDLGVCFTICIEHALAIAQTRSGGMRSLADGVRSYRTEEISPPRPGILIDIHKTHPSMRRIEQSLGKRRLYGHMP